MRIGSLSFTLLCLFCSCARSGAKDEAATREEVPVESADPEWTSADLERQLDRIENEIKAGTSGDAAAARSSDRSGKISPDARKPLRGDRNKSNSGNKDAAPKIQASGSGSS